jgi:hypothetical protein
LSFEALETDDEVATVGHIYSQTNWNYVTPSVVGRECRPEAEAEVTPAAEATVAAATGVGATLIIVDGLADTKPTTAAPTPTDPAEADAATKERDKCQNCVWKRSENSPPPKKKVRHSPPAEGDWLDEALGDAPLAAAKPMTSWPRTAGAAARRKARSLTLTNMAGYLFLV